MKDSLAKVPNRCDQRVFSCTTHNEGHLQPTEVFAMKKRAMRQPLNGILHFVAFVLAAFTLSHAYGAASNLPEVTPEGLKLVPNTKVSAVYLRDGADFSGYDKVKILDCYVAFRKNWKLDHNGGSLLLVSDSDMTRIKTQLADEFKKVFTRELAAKGQALVTVDGKGVLILRPAIINLDVTAPDTMSVSPSRSFSTSAGQATLFLELYDSVTGELLARAYDAELAGESGFIGVRNGMTNRSDADRVLTKWATILGTFLENARNSGKLADTPGK